MAGTIYAVMVGGANVDGVWRGLVTIVELIYPRPYIFQPAVQSVYGRLMCSVIYVSDRLLTQTKIEVSICPPNQNFEDLPGLVFMECAF
jgi:hypothetical protein